MSNKKLYKDTFNKINMSDDALEKIRNMSANEIKPKKIFRFKYATAVAALAFMFVLSNVIVYAASGETLIQKIAVSINGETHTANMKGTEKVGGTYYKFKITYKNGYVNEFGFLTDEAPADWDKDKIALESGTNDNLDEVDNMLYSEVKEKDGKVYLVIDYGLKEIDITEDYQDGKADGEFQLDGESYKYTIEQIVDHITDTEENIYDNILILHK